MSRQNDLEIEVLFDAPREEVFRNWTEAERMGTWFAPEGFEVTSCSVQAHAGGEWRVTYRSAHGVEYVEYGQFRTVDEPERLIFTLTQIEAGRTVLTSLVTVTFTSVGSGTRMSFRQSGFDTPAQHDDFQGGWGECFRKLARGLERSQPGAAGG